MARRLSFQWVSQARPPPYRWPLCHIICALLQGAGSLTLEELLDLCQSETAHSLQTQLAAENERFATFYTQRITFAHLEGCLIEMAEKGWVRVYIDE